MMHVSHTTCILQTHFNYLHFSKTILKRHKECEYCLVFSALHSPRHKPFYNGSKDGMMIWNEAGSNEKMCMGQVWGRGVEDETWVNSSISSCLHYFPTRNNEAGYRSGIAQRHRHVNIAVCFYTGMVKMPVLFVDL